jgi:hypothetical protein
MIRHRISRRTRPGALSFLCLEILEERNLLSSGPGLLGLLEFVPAVTGDLLSGRPMTGSDPDAINVTGSSAPASAAIAPSSNSGGPFLAGLGEALGTTVGSLLGDLTAPVSTLIPATTPLLQPTAALVPSLLSSGTDAQESLPTVPSVLPTGAATVALPPEGTTAVSVPGIAEVAVTMPSGNSIVSASTPTPSSLPLPSLTMATGAPLSPSAPTVTPAASSILATIGGKLADPGSPSTPQLSTLGQTVPTLTAPNASLEASVGRAESVLVGGGNELALLVPLIEANPTTEMPAAAVNGTLNLRLPALSTELTATEAVHSLPVTPVPDNDELEADPADYAPGVVYAPQTPESSESLHLRGEYLEAALAEQAGGTATLPCVSEVVLTQVAYWTSQIRTAAEELPEQAAQHRTLLLVPAIAAAGVYFFGRWYCRENGQKSRPALRE